MQEKLLNGSLDCYHYSEYLITTNETIIKNEKY